MTFQKEDFIKQLLTLGGNEHLVLNKDLAFSLQVSSASVTEMLNKLEKEHLVIYVPYKGSRLSEEGVAIATSLIRSHRLWEVFLMEHLGYGWEEIHEVAEHLEHATDALLASRLEAYLGYPEHCPHGDVIPHGDGSRKAESRLTPLDEIQEGETVVIKRVEQENDLLEYLAAKSLVLGTQCILLERKPYEESYLIQVAQDVISLSHKAALKIFVERIHSN